MKKYYLAYGSNLNVRQMALRCPTAKPVGTAVIKDYELLFKGSKTGAGGKGYLERGIVLYVPKRI